MQAAVEATRQYWWLFAVIGAVVAIGLVLWRMPSLRASFAALRCAKPAPARRRVVEAESEYETDSDAGELGEGRLLAHMRPPVGRVAAVEAVEAVEAAETVETVETVDIEAVEAVAAVAAVGAVGAVEAAPKRRGRPGRTKEVTRECTE